MSVFLFTLKSPVHRSFGDLDRPANLRNRRFLTSIEGLGNAQLSVCQGIWSAAISPSVLPGPTGLYFVAFSMRLLQPLVNILS